MELTGLGASSPPSPMTDDKMAIPRGRRPRTAQDQVASYHPILVSISGSRPEMVGWLARAFLPIAVVGPRARTEASATASHAGSTAQPAAHRAPPGHQLDPVYPPYFPGFPDSRSPPSPLSFPTSLLNSFKAESSTSISVSDSSSLRHLFASLTTSSSSLFLGGT